MRFKKKALLMAVFGVFIFFVFAFSCQSFVISEIHTERYSRWICEDNACSKINKLNETTRPLLSLETCKKTCLNEVIWPKPKHFKSTSNKNHSPFLKSTLKFTIEAPPKTTKTINTFLEIFKKDYLKHNDTNANGNTLKVNIKVSDKRDDVLLNLGTDEGYNLQVTKGETIVVTLTSSTFFGARHGLETLSQLIWFDPDTKTYRILHDLEIEDDPSFTYRGVMVDTSRNFFPLPLLKKVVEGMSYAKLNTLHLHLTDSVSFPMKLKNLEWLAEGAYSSKMVYTEEDIEDLIQYGLVRGVRVLLEVDAPSHVSTGWHSHSTDDTLVICDEKDVLNGHLNPDNPRSLEVLKDVYKNLLGLMKNDDIFHIGGDEVNLDCWSETKAAENETDMTVFWAKYTNRMMDQLKSANGDKLPKNIIMWSSPLTNYRYTLSELKHKDRLIVQYWFGSTSGIFDQNIRTIFSTVGHWYLDCGFGPWKPSQKNGVCDPFTSWQKFYQYKPWENDFVRNLTEGGEVCLWSEQVAEESLETRIWPRAAAFAERVWSDPQYFEDDVYFRLDNFREILRDRCLEVAAIWPKWCSLNPGKCR